MLKRIALLFSLVMIFTFSFVFAAEDVLLIAPAPSNEVTITTENASGDEIIAEEITNDVSGEVVTDENASEEVISGEVETPDNTVDNNENGNVSENEEHDHDHDHDTNSNVAGAIIAIVIVIAVVAIVAVLQKK